MTYAIPLSDAGKVFYSKRDQDLEKAVVFLVDRIGEVEWNTRKSAVRARLQEKLNLKETPPEGVSLRDREDEFGWYLFLAETLIADPVTVDSDQANRIAPYLSAFGRKLEKILQIGGVEALLNRLTRLVKNQDPDQVIFEILVAAAYVQDGWNVIALPATGASKSPDFEIQRGLRRFELECKRFTRRAEYANRERDAWLRQWNSLARLLYAQGGSLILTIKFHVELQRLPPGFLIDFVFRHLSKLNAGREVSQDGVSISAVPVNYNRIAAELANSYAKVGSARERFLITGRYERDMGFTSTIYGKPVHIGPLTVASNRYWDSIDYVTAAFWKCDAKESMEAKARDVLTRLSQATAQFSGRLPGIVHLGIEAEADDIEWIRATKIRTTIRKFDARGQPLAWVFVHYFRGESNADGSWSLDETIDWHGGEPEFFRPLRSDFVVIPETVPSREGFHFDPPPPTGAAET